MTCPECGSANTGDAAAATYADSVCKDCGNRFMHEDINCPACGYDKRDAMTHGDHWRCKNYPFFPSEVDEAR